MSLTNEQYDTLMRIYDERMLDNEAYVREHKRLLYLHIPKLKDIDDDIASMAVAEAKERLMGKEEQSDTLHESILSLTKEKERLIKEAGYPSDYLVPPYYCKDCKDTGYVDGKRCHCFTQASIDILYTQSHIRERLLEHNFDTFSFDYYSEDEKDEKTGRSAREYAERAFDAAERFIRDFDSEFANLLIYGMTGTGKTFLSDCIAKELIESGHTVVYLSAFSLFEILHDGAFAKSGEEPKEYANLFTADLLIIDDLGTEFANSMTNSQLFSCINERLIRRKSTIISTNLNMEDLSERYTGRVFSRFMEHYTFVRMVAKDIRMQKRMGQSG